jgi:hypothetical protein
VFAEALDHQPVEVLFPSGRFERLFVLVVEVELLAFVLNLRPERDLPVGRDPVGAHSAADLGLTL